MCGAPTGPIGAALRPAPGTAGTSGAGNARPYGPVTASPVVKSPARPAVTVRLTGCPATTDRDEARPAADAVPPDAVPADAVPGRAEGGVPGVTGRGARPASVAGACGEGDVLDQDGRPSRRVQRLHGDEALHDAAVAASQRRGQHGLRLEGRGGHAAGVDGDHRVVPGLTAISRRGPSAQEGEGGGVTFRGYVGRARARSGCHHRDRLVVDQATRRCHGERRGHRGRLGCCGIGRTGLDDGEHTDQDEGGRHRRRPSGASPIGTRCDEPAGATHRSGCWPTPRPIVARAHVSYPPSVHPTRPPQPSTTARPDPILSGPGPARTPGRSGGPTRSSGPQPTRLGDREPGRRLWAGAPTAGWPSGAVPSRTAGPATPGRGHHHVRPVLGQHRRGALGWAVGRHRS